MEWMSLREAAERTARSITTLRRYIRSGRLPAEKRQGRFGPEYFVCEDHLMRSGLAVRVESAALSASLAPVAAVRSVARVEREQVPISLFQELQMKHEQLLVQYGMMRAGGLRALEYQAELEAKRREAEASQAEVARVQERVVTDGAELRRRLREGELELEGLRLENAALREKVRALELITRNAVTNEVIERQFSEVLGQMRRVDRLAAEHDTRAGSSPALPSLAPRGSDH